MADGDIRYRIQKAKETEERMRKAQQGNTTESNYSPPIKSGYSLNDKNSFSPHDFLSEGADMTGGTDFSEKDDE